MQLADQLGWSADVDLLMRLIQTDAINKSPIKILVQLLLALVRYKPGTSVNVMSALHGILRPAFYVSFALIPTYTSEIDLSARLVAILIHCFADNMWHKFANWASLSMSPSGLMSCWSDNSHNMLHCLTRCVICCPQHSQLLNYVQLT